MCGAHDLERTWTFLSKVTLLNCGWKWKSMLFVYLFCANFLHQHSLPAPCPHSLYSHSLCVFLSWKQIRIVCCWSQPGRELNKSKWNYVCWSEILDGFYGLQMLTLIVSHVILSPWCESCEMYICENVWRR